MKHEAKQDEATHEVKDEEKKRENCYLRLFRLLGLCFGRRPHAHRNGQLLAQRLDRHDLFAAAREKSQRPLLLIGKQFQETKSLIILSPTFYYLTLLLEAVAGLLVYSNGASLSLAPSFMALNCCSFLFFSGVSSPRCSSGL